MRKRVLTVWVVTVLAMIYGESYAQGRDVFDRIFSNRNTRESLSEARAKFNLNADIPVEDEEIYQQRNLRVNGVVISGSGQKQIWVNNNDTPTSMGPVDAAQIDTSVASLPKVALTISGGSRVVLKPGEVYSLETGAVREVYQQQQFEEVPIVTEPEEETEAEEEDVVFDESKLAEQDTRIRLLEEQLEKIQSSLEQAQ